MFHKVVNGEVTHVLCVHVEASLVVVKNKNISMRFIYDYWRDTL